MARDPSITIAERVAKAARRWLALSNMGEVKMAEVVRRVGELESAVRAYEKFHGMKPLSVKNLLPKRAKKAVK